MVCLKKFVVIWNAHESLTAVSKIKHAQCS